jgi:hypothetical protein
MTIHSQNFAKLPDDDVLISTDMLPSILMVSTQTLARWRCEGSGPSFHKAGRKVLYRAGDVRQWLAQHAHNHTSD